MDFTFIYQKAFPSGMLFLLDRFGWRFIGFYKRLLESKLDDILDQVDEKAYTTAYLDFFPKTFQFDNDKFDEFENCIDG